MLSVRYCQEPTLSLCLIERGRMAKREQRAKRYPTAVLRYAAYWMIERRKEAGLATAALT
jgi:hypothetical protein